MKISISLFGLALDRYAPLAVAAEAAGFDTVWLADHLATPTRRDTAYPYSPTGDPGYDAATPIADVWVTGGHIAALTTQIRIATGVYILPLRPAVVSARSASTLQSMSDGRFVFGIGTGWLEEEFAAAGAAFDRRGLRTDEIIEAMRGLWTGEPTSFTGTEFTIPEITIAPTIPSPIPIVVGGTAPPALRRTAALGDGWYGPPCALADAVMARATIDGLRERTGRAGAFEYFVRLVPPYDERAIDSFHDAGFDHVVVTLAGAGAAATDALDRQIEVIQRTGQLPRPG